MTPRLLPSLALGCVLSVPFGSVYAQDAAAPAAPAAPPAAAPQLPVDPLADLPKELVSDCEDFFHFATVGRFDQAKATGEKILAASHKPLDVMNAFEGIIDQRNRHLAFDRRLDLYERMLAWQGVPELREPVAKLLAIFRQAKLEKRADMAFIEANVMRLGSGHRAYQLAVDSLKESGELAVPVLLMHLQNPSDKALHPYIRTAIRDMGIRALNPLVAAAELTGKDQDDLLGWVISSLGDLGYDNAVPCIARIYRARLANPNDPIAKVAYENLIRLGVKQPQDLNPAQAYFELAQKFYYEKAAIAADRALPIAFVWTWTDGRLTKKDVPTPVFNEHMALRAAKAAVELDAARGDAISLLLAAAYRREIDMPANATDPIWTDKTPSAHFFAVAAGVQHLNPVLARAVEDGDAALALKAVQSLDKIVGENSVQSSQAIAPLMAALHYPDRSVRFEAAIALAKSVARKPFVGQEQVVAILAEALGQTGKPGVLVMASSQDELNARIESITAAGAYNARGGVGAEQAVAAAGGLPSVDVILMDEKDAAQTDRLQVLVRGNVRLEPAARLVFVESAVASPYAKIAQTNRRYTPATRPSNDSALVAAIEAARHRSQGLPIDEAAATVYALRASAQLAELAALRIELGIAQPALLTALDDQRPELAKAAGNVLSLVSTRAAQQALASKAVDEKVAEDLRISFLNNLAANAKAFRNELEPVQIDALVKVVQSGPTPEVRSAAAEAHGALNLPSERLRGLFLSEIPTR